MAQDPYGNWTPVLPDGPTNTSYHPRLHAGEGVPDNDLGNNGDVYVDVITGDAYTKSGGTWSVIQGAAGGSGEVGNGSPEGVVAAAPGTTYWDKLNLQLWLKSTGSGNTGWSPY